MPTILLPPEAKSEAPDAIDGVAVNYLPSPLSREGHTFIVVQPGQTLEAALAPQLPPWWAANDWVATINGRLIERPLWGQHVIGQTDVISVRAIVRGGGRGGSNPIAVILSIAVLVAAPYLAAAIAPSLGITTVAGIQTLSALISVVGIVIVNALFPPRLPESDTDGEAKPQYSISGGVNRARPYEPLALLFGTHRIFPDLASQEYTEYDENGDQFLNQIFEFPFGDDLVIEGMQIGETALVSRVPASARQAAPDTEDAPANNPDPSVPRDVSVGRTSNKDGTTTTVRWKAPVNWGAGSNRRYGRRYWRNASGGQKGTPRVQAGWVTLADTTSTSWSASSSLNRPQVKAETDDGMSEWVGASAGPAPSGSSPNPTTAQAPPPLAVDSPNFDGVQMQAQVATIDLVAGNVDTISGGGFETQLPSGRENGTPYITRTTAGETTAVAFDLVSQHFNSTDSGKLEGRTAFFELGWKANGSVSWRTRHVDVVTPDGAEARNATRRSVKIGGLPAGAYDLRVRLRAVYDDDDELDKITYRASCPVMRAYQDSAADFTGRNPLALKIKATGQLYGRLETVNATCKQLIPDWNGTAWVDRQETSNPASVLRKWLQGFRVDGKLRAGYGLEAAKIDDESLQGWHAFCVTHELECNVVLQDDRDEDAIARMICQCGWARLDTSTGKYGVLWENEGQPTSAVVTPANVVAGSVNVSYENENLADKIIGEYIDRDSDWQQNTLRRDVPQFTITGEFPITIPLEGITSGEHAAKEINRTAAAQFYHQRQITWEMTEEGFLGIGVGDVIGIAHANVNSAEGGRLLAMGPDRRTVTPNFAVTAAGRAWVWDLNGDVVETTYTVASNGAMVLAAAIPRPPADVSFEDEHPTMYRVMAFQDGAFYTKVRVVGMEPADQGRFRFFARDEIQAYYDFRTSDLSMELIPYGRRIDPPRIENFAVTENDAGVRVFTWSVPKAPHQGFQIRYGPSGTEFPAMTDLHEGLLTGSPWESFDKPDEGTWRFGIVAIGPDPQRVRGPVAYAEATLGEVVRGLDGTDGNGYEDIFLATDALSIPAADRPSNDWGFDVMPQTAGAVTWQDGIAGTGFGADKPYLWRATRRVPGTPAVGADIDAAWADAYERAGRRGETPPSGDWEPPVIVGRFAVDGEQGPQGIAGANGEDGQTGATGADGEEGLGVEYVFCQAAKSVTSIPANQRPLDTWAYDRPQARNELQWHDGAPALTDALPKLWRSERAVPGLPAAGDTPGADWGSWTIPVVVGELGRGVEYVFARTASASLARAQRPSNSWGFDEPGTAGTGDAAVSWTDAAPPITSALPYLWRAEREIVGLPAVGGAVAAQWEPPVIVGRFAVDGEQGPQGIAGADGEDGQPGATGADGQEGLGVEYVFCQTAKSVTSIRANQRPLDTWAYDRPRARNELQWHDGAPDLTDALPKLWRSERAVPGLPAAGDTPGADWGSWTVPVAVGELGRGVEYVFARTASASLARAQRPSNSWGFDEPDPPWTDGAPPITSALPYLWRAEREIVGLPAVGAAVAARWSAPVIVGRFAVDGESAAPTIEFIFARTADTVTSIPARQRPRDTWPYDRPAARGGLTWSDGAPGLTQALPIMWQSQRKVPAGTEAGDAVSDNWTTPVVVGRYGEAGVAGADGEDGSGIEFIFTATSSTSSPSSPSNSWGFDQPASPWSDAAPNLNATNAYLWMSQRRILGSPNVDDSVSGNWTTPRLVARFGPEGPAGGDGDDGTGITKVTATERRDSDGNTDVTVTVDKDDGTSDDFSFTVDKGENADDFTGWYDRIAFSGWDALGITTTHRGRNNAITGYTLALLSDADVVNGPLAPDGSREGTMTVTTVSARVHA